MIKETMKSIKDAEAIANKMVDKANEHAKDTIDKTKAKAKADVENARQNQSKKNLERVKSATDDGEAEGLRIKKKSNMELDNLLKSVKEREEESVDAVLKEVINF